MFSLTLDIKTIDKTSIIKKPKSFQTLMLKNNLTFNQVCEATLKEERDNYQEEVRFRVWSLILGFIKIVTQ
jgi:hypothetical protein